ncbi:hypothetical protein [Mucilaginibacter dorajii]|uniref:HNH endonuclease n=1 Tax=Mucilaginibacter dorajii TaxID=692994 RepID=A0ABP7PZ71_9SPHI|nr:hypothetical protein [Mucilaginibacter dorajii]MCS3732996.1 hypothetical protein [Mucilaginibacter dorajii]
MNPNRDNFSVETKRILGSRVAYRCCYLGCPAITIGPNTTDSQKFVNLGEAAHIHAAAPGGPRYLATMTAEQRKSIENGIWMCKKHARLIDANYGNYSAETLLQWKQSLEIEAYKQLKSVDNIVLSEPTTIVCLNPNLMFEGLWKAANNDSWTFTVKEFIYGDINLLREYGSKINEPFKKYIIVESQGDGRLINNHFQWEQKANGIEISLQVFPSVIRRDPNNIGSDISTGLDGDIQIEDGDLKIVSGKAFAKQLIERNLSIELGSWLIHPRVGSLFTKYYHKFKSNQSLLNRIVKVEITRLMTIPTGGGVITDQPELNFINRIHEVIVMEALDGIVPVFISLEWGDGSFESDTLHIHLYQPNYGDEVIFDELPDFIKHLIDQGPLEQMKRLTSKLNQDELQEKINGAAIMRIFKDLLPAIMQSAADALNTEVYPLFDSYILYRSYDNNTFEYNTSYDVERILYQGGTIQQVGVTISLKGFKKAGTKAFDVTSSILVFFNDYNYVVGNSGVNPWLIKMYHQMPSDEEIERLANQLINNTINQINQKVLNSGLILL